MPTSAQPSGVCASSWLLPPLAPPLTQQGLVTQWDVALGRLHSGGCLARLRRPGHRTCYPGRTGARTRLGRSEEK
ncbi:hypothetical protein HaLaN_29897 [Haematococcus lacustris]|uniref:Uncharacterized protein n=1 Tax=Haematococcus lacustris TaxID=44745 RepID=A0A6A0AGH2_HAELA|nr:hypothetical protein HaLaN_29897 [Haematococcus lacustris]